MKLEQMTWHDVDRRIQKGAAIMLPVGSTEQHGPIGRIGTDTICADAVAQRAAEECDAIVAPALAYTPAPFNTSFAGTVSVSPEVFIAYAREIIRGLLDQGFLGVYVVNGHGANLAPLSSIGAELETAVLKVRSWWEPDEINNLRKELYGHWEGMHATPSEIAITQTLLGTLSAEGAIAPPRRLSAKYVREHSGDRHGPPDEHRAMFPDGRVGSHSALATPEDGARILQLSAQAIAKDFIEFEQIAGE
ncbi:creatininase family protein [Pseudophaeobacter sp. EL27]|uniref:creatininase family protein n=1 Tax=Pseudophaeobacter sp. EL27 TaxID=2107580 RepID=UPI000EFB0E0C|nr:creatininase family protein [Pseudophaeobacter sp. EL27]